MEPGEIIHYIQMMDRLIDGSLIPLTKPELEKEVITILDSGKVHALSFEQWERMISLRVYNNYGFSDFRDSWYSDLIEKLKETSISKSVEDLKNDFIEKLSTNKSIVVLCHNLENKVGTERFRNVPILKVLKPDELLKFASGLACLDYRDFDEVVFCLKSRYGFGGIGLDNKVLLDEYDNFCRIIELLCKFLDEEEPLFNPHYYVLSHFIKELSNIKAYLEEKVEKRNSPDLNNQSVYI